MADLTVAASSCSAFDAKGGSLAGLPYACDDFAVQIGPKSLADSHCCGGLALSKGCWGDARHHHCKKIQRITNNMDCLNVALHQLSKHVKNRLPGFDRPGFTYRSFHLGLPSGCPRLKASPVRVIVCLGFRHLCLMTTNVNATVL